MTLIIMTLSITISSITIRMQDLALITLRASQHSLFSVIVPSFVMLSVIFFNLMPGVIMLNVIMPSVGAPSLSNS
jgi:hypothetical protein